jgi:peptidoglycan/xylan/chitin deacetylase (PgdA/CDA1 family)
VSKAVSESAETIPVLLYHSVPQADAAAEGLAVPRELFRAHLEVIAAAGRTPIGVGDLAAALRGEHPLPARPVTITFDDAYEDTPTAVELVLSYGLSASVFVTTGQVDRTAMIRRDQLEALASESDRIELGAHTVSHPFLDELDLAQVEWEVRESKCSLEETIGRRVSTFAYPFGAHDRAVRAAVVDAGFSAAAAVKNALSHPEDDPFAIARWTVSAGTTPKQIARVLDGGGAPRAWQRERLRTRGYRALRRLRSRRRSGGSS